MSFVQLFLLCCSCVNVKGRINTSLPSPLSNAYFSRRESALPGSRTRFQCSVPRSHYSWLRLITTKVWSFTLMSFPTNCLIIGTQVFHTIALTATLSPNAISGINCRFGMKGVAAAAHYDGGRNFVAMLRGRKRYALRCCVLLCCCAFNTACLLQFAAYVC